MAQRHSAAGAHDSHGTPGTHDSHDSHEAHGSLKSYVIGFLMSLVLTAIPLIVVLNHLLEGKAATLLLLGSAVLQFVVQLVYFMHLKEEGKPRYNLMVLILGLFIVLTIVAGSIWIMTYNKVA
ncbi:cytochrome o ubiquinol oxidase subunit IV [Cohnella silvisoli]|uniref:Cytochrome o ubiquinol oxidase subunit IV n=1 Tax=Cohnella silvisoli TaxID=2873699 RepID=A0ABV1KPW4_9BACL|nr:cytochrome o ubiquinol oxidase subunit IV [Cohnella silvisoli]MCD9022205.1 cytochrome o ubiquinol oxidase subunit IV [Cohnella silvisoli]